MDTTQITYDFMKRIDKSRAWESKFDELRIRNATIMEFLAQRPVLRPEFYMFNERLSAEDIASLREQRTKSHAELEAAFYESLEKMKQDRDRVHEEMKSLMGK